jgi:NADH-quinone oxidoreductase subunit D
MPPAPTSAAPGEPGASATSAARHTQLWATGPMGLLDGTIPIPLPPGHPAGHGSLRLRLQIDGDIVVAANPIIGSVHRGAEKLFEVRDYRQILALANRHDWLGGFAGELTVALVVEAAFGMVVPERATWLRMVLAEVSRLHSHLVFLGAAPHPDEPRRPIVDTSAGVGRMVDLLDDYAGTRMHPMVTAIGGLRADAPEGWAQRVRSSVRAVAPLLDEIAAGFAAPTVSPRHTGLGVLSRDAAEGFGASGPVGRASGVAIDVRLTDPYLAYAACPPVRVREGAVGADVRERWALLIDETRAALEMVERCLDGLAAVGGGPVSIKLPKVVRVPEGQWYAATESPLGLAGVFLVSHGAKTPARLALRTPSWGNVAALAAMLPGTRMTAISDVVASVPFVMGDVDK